MAQDKPSPSVSLAEVEGGYTAAEYRSGFERFSDALTKLSVWLAMGIILLMTGIVAVDLVMRNLANQSLMIVDEVVGQLTVAMAFLGISYGLRRHALLRVELIYRRLSAKAGAVVRICFDLASLFYTVLVIWFGIRLVDSSMRLEVVSLSLLQTPMWIPQMVIPVGGGILILALVAELMRDTRRLVAVWREGGRR
ncbi:MAG: TRAP transporter small permease [Azospirillaceae bacterium]